MPDYDALKDVLGKTIQGVIVKRNPQGTPTMAVHIVFTDGTAYEIYGLYQLSFAKGVNHQDMHEARKYASPPMEIILDVSVED